MVMAYSTQTQVINNVKVIDTTFTVALDKSAFCTERIAEADLIVKVDLSKYVDFDLIDAAPTTPYFINLLAQYKTAEMALIRMRGAKREKNTVDDVSYWHDLYEALLQKIIFGKVDLVLNDGTSVKKAINSYVKSSRTDVNPKFGYDKYDKWCDDEDLAELREADDNE